MIHKITCQVLGSVTKMLPKRKLFLYFEMGLYKLCYDQIRGWGKLEKTGSHCCLWNSYCVFHWVEAGCGYSKALICNVWSSRIYYWILTIWHPRRTFITKNEINKLTFVESQNNMTTMGTNAQRMKRQ